METKELEIVNKVPDGYIEARFGSYVKGGISIQFDDVFFVEEYSLALYSKIYGCKLLNLNNKDIYYEDFATQMETDTEWELCITFNEDNEEKVKYLRRVDINIEN